MEFSKKTKNIIDKINKIEPNSIININIYCDGEYYDYSVGNREYDETCYFQIGSNTKLFTAAYICKLIEEGKIDPGDRLSKYLELNEKYTYPTIENLLTHHGYRPILSREFVWNYLFRKHLLYKNVYKGKKSESLMNYLLYKKPPKKLFYYYSDINYAILGLVIEKISGKRYEDVMEEFIKNDLHLYQTSFHPDETKILNSYHKKRIAGNLEWENGDIYKAAGGIYSTASDALKYLKIVLDGNISYINETIVKRKTILFGKIKMGVGYGWHCYITGKYFFHKGGVVCYRTNCFLDTKKKICVSVMGNVIGDKFYNTTTLGISINKDLKELLKNKKAK